MTTTTTLSLQPCLHRPEAGAEVPAGGATPTPLITTVTRIITITTATTTTTTAVAMMTHTTGTRTTRPPAGGEAVAEATGAEPHLPEDPEAGPATPSVAGPDRAVAADADQEADSREDEEGYVVHGAAAVEM